MGKKQGFTLVELAVTIAIMVILLVVAAVSFRGMQSSARDKERDTDVQSIAMYLESLYQREIRDSAGSIIKPAGSYPSRAVMNDTTYFDIVFGELPQGSMYSPLNTNRAFIANTNTVPHAVILSTNVAPQPTDTPSTHDSYVYVPLLTASGNTCQFVTEECRTFRIYYYKEKDHVIRTIEAKRK